MGFTGCISIKYIEIDDGMVRESDNVEDDLTYPLEIWFRWGRIIYIYC